MHEPVKESKNSINSHHEHMAGCYLIEIERFIHDQKHYVQYLSYQKGSTELSNLCTTKARSPSVSYISIGNLKFNILLQIESLYVARGWEKSSKLA